MAASKVVIGLYTGKNSGETFLPNVIDLMGRLREVDQYGGYIKHSSSRVDANRNRLIKDFLENSKGDYLFILDDDMRHPPRMPEILAARDKPIISGLYFRRAEDLNYHPVLYRNAGEGPSPKTMGHGEAWNVNYRPITPEVAAFFREAHAPDTDEPTVFTMPDGSLVPEELALLPIDACGFGCLLLRRDALELLKAPWLLDEPGLHGDLAFGKRARAAGIEMWGDLSVIASHRHERWLGIHGFTEYLFEIERRYGEMVCPTLT